MYDDIFFWKQAGNIYINLVNKTLFIYFFTIMELWALSPDAVSGVTSKAIDLAMTRWPKLVWALITLWVWLWIIKKLSAVAAKWFTKAKMDVTVSKFLSSMIWVWLKVLLLVSVAGMFGIETTSFVAILWAAGLAVGLALQWSLANFAGGVLILIFKPYQAWDLVEAQGVLGTVKEISIFTTNLLTPENKIAIIPNGAMANGNITNYTSEWVIRVDVNVGIAYDEDIDNARSVLSKVISENPDVMQNHAGNGIYVAELADSSVNLIVRWYTHPSKYRDVFFGMTEASKKALDASGIDIPFPHRVIHTVTD